MGLARHNHEGCGLAARRSRVQTPNILFSLKKLLLAVSPVNVNLSGNILKEGNLFSDWSSPTSSSRTWVSWIGSRADLGLWARVSSCERLDKSGALAPASKSCLVSAGGGSPCVFAVASLFPVINCSLLSASHQLLHLYLLSTQRGAPQEPGPFVSALFTEQIL